MKKKAKDLERGDKIVLEDGTTATIKEVTNGMYISSKLIHFTNGLWSCILNNDIVETIS